MERYWRGWNMAAETSLGWANAESDDGEEQERNNEMKEKEEWKEIEKKVMDVDDEGRGGTGRATIIVSVK